MGRPCTSWALVLGAILSVVLVGPVRAGEELSAEELLQSSDAVALVERSLTGPGTRVLEWWRGGGETSPPQEWSSLCVPDRATLQAWVERLPEHPGQPLWQQLLQVPAYRSVVFFVRRDAMLRPRCEAEAMRGLQVTLHPQHGAWRERLKVALAAAPLAAPATDGSAAVLERSPLRGPSLRAVP